MAPDPRSEFQYGASFAFRVPALPMSLLTAWADGVQAPSCPDGELAVALARDRALLRQRLRAIVKRPAVTAALSVASPDLLDALRDRARDPGVEASLVRYVSRMASRATPFGLFAACGVGTIDERTEIALPDPAGWRRHTRLDGDYLDRVVRDRAGELRPRLTFRPNDSLYRVGGRRRYVQTRLEGLRRSHHLAEIGDSDHLTRALAGAHSGATPEQIAAAVTAAGVEPGRASTYVEELIDAQVLVPALAVPVTGASAVDTVIADLKAAGDHKTAAMLAAVRRELAAIDAAGMADADDRHDVLAVALGGLPAPERRSRLLQVDATVPECGATLARSTVDEVVRGVELLRRVGPARDQSELERFREAFVERYKQREVPLLEALDDDLGAGFGYGGGDPAPLLKGLARPAIEPSAAFGRRERRLLELLHRAWTAGVREVALGPDDVEALQSDDPRELPDAVEAMAVIARTREGPRVLVSFASGPPGVRLLGRFCHADPALEAHVRAHVSAEEALDPDAIHAEIVHLPAGLQSNVLFRPVLRDWELEWLGRSGAPPDLRLPVSDLLVSVREGRVVLRSRRLGRRVLPRLTSAHDSKGSPAVYRFLAAVASDGSAGSARWSWAPFDHAPFTPRVRSGRLILTRAAWWASRSELRELDVSDPVERWRAVQAWRERRRLPRWVCAVEGDSQLVIDLDNALGVDAFVRFARSREELMLEELYPGPDELVANAPDGQRALELLIPLVRAAPAVATRHSTASLDARPAHEDGGEVPTHARRTFPPGSDWTYLKLYTGPVTADALLRDEIGPLARELIAAGSADRWFFVRYQDLRFHLRVRVHGNPQRIAGALQQLAASALDAGLAFDAQLGTYERELERYGGPDGIEVAERLFQADSDAVIDLLGMFERGEPGLDERWRIGVLGAELLICDFGLDDPARAAFARRMHATFEREHHADARLRKAVAERVRAEQASVAELLAAPADGGHPLAPGIAALAERSERIRPLAAQLAALHARGRLSAAPEELAGSYVHMWLDRLHRSENRFHEYVTYALLARALAAWSARERSGR